jgi:thioredoxin-related protein
MSFRLLAVIIFTFSMTPFLSGADDGSALQAVWLTDFNEAATLATEKDLPILISFSGSDWCLPCMRLERDLFSTEEFIRFSNTHLILLKVDFPARKKNTLTAEQLQHNESLAQTYNQKGAFPLVVLTDPGGKVLGQMTHPLTSADSYIHSIQEIIQR